MSVKLNELPDESISLNDLIAKSDTNGLMTKTNIQKLANYIGAIGSSGMKAAIESTSAAPTEDGLYPCTESGTYTNFGGEVVDISGQLVFISVSESQTVFQQVVISLGIIFDSEPTENSTNAVQSGGVYSFVNNQFLSQYKNNNVVKNPSFSFMDEDVDTNFGNNTGTSTFTVESCIFGGQQVKVNTPDTARSYVGLPFNYIANEFYSLAFIYKVNSGSISPQISSYRLATLNPNNLEVGTARTVDLGSGYYLYLHEGVKYSSDENTIDGYYIDINNISGGSASEIEIIQPAIINSETFKGNYTFNFGNNFSTIQTLINNINSNITTNSLNIYQNTKKVTEIFNPTLVDFLASNTNETSDKTTTMNLFDVEQGKTYKITATTSQSLTSNGLSYYNPSNDVMHNHAQNEDFANGVSYQFEADFTGTVKWRVWQIGITVNFVIDEVKWQSEELNTANGLLEQYKFVELLDLEITKTTTQEELDIKDYQGKELECYIKAPYTGDFVVYSKDNPFTSTTEVKRITNTDFSNGYTFFITVPNDADILTLRTYLIVTLDEFSIKYKRIKNRFLQSPNQWRGKVGSFYGDSITAHSNGDFQEPFRNFTKWGVITSEELQLSKSYVRGIGGQKYDFGTNGGSVAFIDADGNYNSRDDNYNYDNYIGNVTVPTGTTPIRGAYSSWLRITTMFPTSIKDDIDFVFIMGGTNDLEDNTDAVWIPNDTTDTEWANSTEYLIHDGDFNIDSLAGGLASTILKFQVWMPNALIIIGTPLSGRGTTGQYNYTIVTKEYNITQKIKEQSGKLSIPLVNVYEESGINGWNRLKYITDNVHPFNQDGNNMLSRTVSGGISRFYPIYR